ncbi:hypothetical protein [Cellulomonas hominis]
MKRLFWVAVGVAGAVVVIRRAGDLSERYLPAGATGALGTVGRVALALGTARSEFAAGLAEREAQLRHDLIGDVDIDALRTERDERRRADRAGEPGDTADPDRTGHGHRRGGRPDTAAARAEARARRAARGWEHEPTEDSPDDEGELPYSFY